MSLALGACTPQIIGPRPAKRTPASNTPTPTPTPDSGSTGASSLLWSEGTLTKATTLHAGWTAPTSSQVASLKIRLFNDASCSSLSSEVALSSTSASSYSFSPAQEGSWTFRVVSTQQDSSLNLSDCSSSIMVDQTPPNAPTVPGFVEGSVSSATTPHAVWSQSVNPDADSLSLQLYTGASCLTPSGSPLSLQPLATSAALTGLADGTYSYTLTLTDQAQNSATSVCSSTITLDRVAPVIQTFSLSTGSPTRAPSIPVSRSFADTPVRYCLLVNDTDPGNCIFSTGTVPTSFSPTTQGSITLTLWIEDLAGNRSAPVSTSSFVFDSIAPAPVSAVSLSNPASSPGTESRPSFTLTGVENGATATIHRDDSTCAPASVAASGVAGPGGSVTLQLSVANAMPEGTSQFYARVTDAAGNTSNCSAAYASYRYDNTPPPRATEMVWAGGSGTSNSRSITATWTPAASDLASQDLLVYANSTCTGAAAQTVVLSEHDSSWLISGDNNTNYSFRIRSRDTVGLTATSACSPSILIQSQSPTLASFSYSQSSPGSGALLSFVYGEADAPFTSRCLLVNSNDPSTCSWVAASSVADLPQNMSLSQGDGSYTFSMFLKDASGTIGSRIDSNPYVLDTTRPVLGTVTLNSNNPAYSRTRSLQLAFSAPNEPISAWCALEDSTDVQGCAFVTASSLPSSYTVSEEGPVALTFFVKDRAGNVSDPLTSSSITIDSLPPAIPGPITLSNPASSPGNLSTPTFQLPGIALGDTARLYSSGADCEAVTNAIGVAVSMDSTVPVSITTQTLSEGITPVFARVTDPAGNRSTCVQGPSYELDSTPPPAATTLAWNEGYVTQTGNPVLTARWTPAASDLVSQKIEFYQNASCSGAPQSVVTSLSASTQSRSFTASTLQTYTFKIRSVDAASNETVSACSPAIQIDTSQPALESLVLPALSRSTNIGPVYSYSSYPFDSWCLLQDTSDLSTCSWSQTALPDTLTITGSDGPHTFTVFLRDSSGYVGAGVSRTVTLDTTPPGVSYFVSVPLGTTASSRTVPLSYGTFSGSPTSYCIQDTVAPALPNADTCSPVAISDPANPVLPASFLTSGNGTHTLTLWLWDEAGNQSPGISAQVTVNDPLGGTITAGLNSGGTGDASELSWTVKFNPAVDPSTFREDDITNGCMGAGCAQNVIFSVHPVNSDGWFTLRVAQVGGAGQITPVIAAGTAGSRIRSVTPYFGSTFYQYEGKTLQTLSYTGPRVLESATYACACTGTSSNFPFGNPGSDGSRRAPFEVCSSSQLAKIASVGSFNLNYGPQSAIQSGRYVLCNNIDLLSSTQWEPILGFKGVFDGNKKTLSNLNQSSGTSNISSLFGTVVNARIQNLTLDQGSLGIPGGLSTGGAVAQMASFSTFDRIVVRGFNLFGRVAGGIVGETTDQTLFTNLSIEGVRITASEFGGGIAGKAAASTFSRNRIKDGINLGIDPSEVVFTLIKTSSDSTSSIGGIVGTTDKSALITQNDVKTGLFGQSNRGGLIGKTNSGADPRGPDYSVTVRDNLVTFFTPPGTGAGNGGGGLIGRGGGILTRNAVWGGVSWGAGLVGMVDFLTTVAECYSVGSSPGYPAFGILSNPALITFPGGFAFPYSNAAAIPALNTIHVPFEDLATLTRLTSEFGFNPDSWTYPDPASTSYYYTQAPIPKDIGPSPEPSSSPSPSPSPSPSASPSPADPLSKFMVVLKDSRGVTQCAGAILDEFSILTTGDCAALIDGGTAYVGVTVLDDLGSAQAISISSGAGQGQIIPHPDFVPRGVAHNLAIFKPASPISFNNEVGAVQLPASELPIDPSTSLLGFSLTGWQRYDLESLEPAGTIFEGISPQGFVSGEPGKTGTGFTSGLFTVVFDSTGQTLLGFGLGRDTKSSQEANVTVSQSLEWILQNMGPGNH